MIINKKVSMSEALKVDLYPQANENVIIKDKFRIMNNEELAQQTAKYNAELEGKGRIMIRASGTEPKIRVMVESRDSALNQEIAQNMVDLIKKIDEEY